MLLFALLIYVACGLLLSAYVMWRRWRVDHAPLVEHGEWLFAAIALVVMTLTWPLWLYRMLEVGL